MNVFVTTLGCRLNEAEIARLSRDLRARGHAVVGSPAAADAMVVNTCAVTTEAARKSRKLISGLHRKNPEAPIVATGCFATLEPQRVAQLAGVDEVVTNGDKDALCARLLQMAENRAMPALAAEPGESPLHREARTRAFVKVQDGCKNRCTFCIVTVARGNERSTPIASVVDEIRGLAEAGYREAVLTGVHLGGYGRDLGTDLSALVRAILADTDIPRLRLSSLEPWDLPDGFGELWKDARLLPHVHLPLQSGADSVLRRMARRCDMARFEALVCDLRHRIADLTVTTDLIVGFPGETEAEFLATADAVRRIGFGHVHIFSYSPRPGTTAARMTGEVPGEVKRARARALFEIAAAQKRAHLSQFLGSVRQVLWEQVSERGLTGYTDNYLRVVSAHGDPALAGEITPARLLHLGEPADHVVAGLA
ncbi:MAG TPA: tRNA (N(6)-L-threonylcarbamoyladenosine(37)-C(2))-methylthiotransferase MtaB [Kofleriaceae bacterium]|nr:tRNA (N(6)-L-threonylcarbamoyladenosine(37)-C(2))-methylthiotransferase MtaB [Kofleriaceae bacterium]